MGLTWRPEPGALDYRAAGEYLALLADPITVKRIVRRLEEAPVTVQKAKDILRAAQLTLLGADDATIAANLAKVAEGVALSPVLLVRGDLASGIPLHVADGYHRVCASCLTDENADIPVKLVG